MSTAAEALARDIRQARARLPSNAAAQLTQNVRALVAQNLVGPVPQAAAIALFSVIAANIIADLLVELDLAMPHDGAPGDRTRAAEEVFTELLRAAVAARKP